MRVCNSHMKVRENIHTSYPCLYYIKMMDEKEVSNFIRDCNIGVDNECIKQALMFLERHVGKLAPGEEQYQALAATAIAGETGLVRDVTLTRRVRSGITLEHVMRHIGKLSKEEYIKVVKRQVSKWRQAPDWLNIKVTNLNICYRIYKKYRSVFDDLAKDTAFSLEPIGFNLMAIFWIVFLYIKNEDPLFESTAQQVTLLHCIFLFTFSEISVNIERGRVNSAFLKYFPEGKTPNQEKYMSLKARILEGLGKVHTYRQKQGFFQATELASVHISTRFLDDLSNIYEKFKARLPQNTINEISFLEIEKSLTPQSIKVPNFSSSTVISKVLDLSKDDDDDDFDFEPEGVMAEQRKWETMFQNPKQVEKGSNFKRMPVSPFRSLPKHEFMTPVSASHANSNWLREIILRMDKYEIDQLQKTYEKYTKKEFAAYKEGALERITLAIQAITPECADFIKRQYEIYNFYIHLVNRIAENHTPFEKNLIFADDQAFNALLCLAFDIFNYANQSLSSCFRKNCQLFGVSILQGHSAIAHLDPPIDMPRTIKDYIYSLEKRILIDQLWQDQSGYSLLSGGVDSFSRKRLEKFVGERAQDLCGRMGIPQKDVIRVINLVKYILSKRAILLKDTRVDQIIVCSIASILNINRSQSRFTLQEVFEHYNQLILSFYSNKDSLYDFYNNIFLCALEDVVNDQHSAILNTPVRLERQRNRQLGIESTPLSKKLLFQPPNFSLSKRFDKQCQSIPEGEQGQEEEGRPRKISYKSTLALQSINSMKNLQKGQEESISPTFRAQEAPVMIDRLFSFGDVDQ